MATTKAVGSAPGGRQSAYRARTRQGILEAARQALADIGLTATIEDTAELAHVSTATIYNHFEGKEALFREALERMWREWVLWAYDGRTEGESLETVIDVCRKMFRGQQTHPQFAQVVKNTFGDTQFVLDSLLGSNAVLVFRAPVMATLADTGNFEQRLTLFASCLTAIFRGVFVSESLNAREADASLGISLAIWGVPPAEAKRIVSRPLDL